MVSMDSGVKMMKHALKDSYLHKKTFSGPLKMAKKHGPEEGSMEGDLDKEKVEEKVEAKEEDRLFDHTEGKEKERAKVKEGEKDI